MGYKEPERRYGDEIRQQFGIEPAALTAAKAEYLIGCRNADEIRNRATKARQENRRARARGVQEESAEQVTPENLDTFDPEDPDIRFARSARDPASVSRPPRSIGPK